MKRLGTYFWRLFLKVRDFLNQLNIVRPMTRYLSNYYKNEKDLVGIEIGVWKGEHAKELLETLPIKKLYLIDPYRDYGRYDDSDELFPNQSFETVFQGTKKLLNPYNDKVVFIREKSKEAIKLTPEKVDFVYVDGNHDYEYVLEDIEGYWDKIIDGGIIGGHDFSLSAYPGVLTAVGKFILDKKIKHNIYSDNNSNDQEWWIVKTRKGDNKKS